MRAEQGHRITQVRRVREGQGRGRRFTRLQAGIILRGLLNHSIFVLILMV